jgi:hypothetical protein
VVDLGEVPAVALKGVPAEFTASELERWSTVSDTPSGRLRHLKPAVQLSETPPHRGATLGSAWLSPPRVAVKAENQRPPTKVASVKNDHCPLPLILRRCFRSAVLH